MPLETGQNIGERYTLISRLGSGGMADVWIARDEMLEREVALKFLHERFAQDVSFVERFRREAQSAAGLQHPNVVGVYDRGEDEGRHWIAMEYVEGAVLKDLIGRGLSVGEAVEIVRQILVGARFAHTRGIVHRDLKPQNVLVDAEGRARVTDFGIARAGASEITATGSVLGTAQYLSPEQAQGLEITAGSDLYSVGVILYEALTGQVPFDAETPVAVALKQVSERPRPPSELNPAVPRALDAVVLRALAKDPANRFATADEFLRALDAAEADPSGESLGDTAAFAAVGAAGALGGGALAGAGADAVAKPPTGELATAPEERGWMTRRRAIALGAIALIGAGVAIWALTRPEQVNVPSVIDQQVAIARSALEQEGFDVSERPITQCAPENTVTEQDPPAGSEVDEGAEVALTVSLGLSSTLPDVRGETLADARKALDEENLVVNSRQESSPGVDAGRVIATEPPAGTQVDCNSPVTIVVSKGQKLIALPGVVGEQQEVAEADLERAGFVVDVDTRDADEEEGTVLEQDPGAGSELPKGERITLVVSTGAGSVTMPNVEGQPRDTAVDQLTGLGLDVDVVEQEINDRGDDERVLDQAPTSGERLRSGDRVTIFVGVFVEEETTTTTLPEPDTQVQP
jgi:beta-lactam-binding protein with PASTA domain/predicted Ser/Thr protein kinase